MRDKVGLAALWVALILYAVSMAAGLLYADSTPAAMTGRVIYLAGLAAIIIPLYRLLVPDAVKQSRRRWDLWRLRGVLDETAVPRESISSELRRFVIERDACVCTYCQREGVPNADPNGQAWHIDHCVPISRGGSTTPHNLTLSCAACNLSKGNKTPVEFMHPKAKARRAKSAYGAMGRERYRKDPRPPAHD